MRCVLLVPVLREAPGRATTGRSAGVPRSHSPDDRHAESLGLAHAIALDVAASLLVPLSSFRPSTLFGSGKVEELKALIAEKGAGLVIVDFALSPVQQRNLEKAWSAKVLDRTGLILEIFGARARTREGRLQVELAHLNYQKSRLVRSWTHLERQRGGAGFLGGPGETQLELDRRMIQDRVEAIMAELEIVVRTRELHRQGRRRVPYPIVAIVGYTNAGKSTLFNRITGAGVLAMDQVFATLDPTMREVRLKSGRRIILSDTVGFISDLPTMLVAAFRATLEEVIEADLVLHVRDISHPECEAQREDVVKVLEGLGIEAATGAGRLIEVWNKVDRLDVERREVLMAAAHRAEPPAVAVSAVSGDGVEALLGKIDLVFSVNDIDLHVLVPPSEGAVLAWLHEHADVTAREVGDDGQMRVSVRIARDKHGRLLSRLSGTTARIEP